MKKRKVIPIISNKGGVAKTTSAVTISSMLAEKGYKTLLIDLDQQHNATTALGVFPFLNMPSIYDAFFEDKCIDDVLIKINYEKLHLVSSANVFSSAVTRLVTEQIPDKDNILKRAINKCDENYDYVIIDCPPALNQLIVNAIMPATKIIIPTETTEYSTMGLKGIVEFINRYSPYMTDFKEFGVLVTSYEKRCNVAEGIVSQLRKVDYLNTFNTLIARSAAIKKAELIGMPINHYEPLCQAAVIPLQTLVLFAF